MDSRLRRILTTGMVLGVIFFSRSFCYSEGNNHRWGVGLFAPYLVEMTLKSYTEVDVARFDWLAVEVHGEGEVAVLKRLLSINPGQRYLVRLWPINHLGHPDRNYQVNFLDYLYKPGVKEEVQRRVRKAVRAAMDNIPESVVGFHFLEELPAHWGFSDLVSWAEDPSVLPWLFEPYREAIEAERGKPLVWNDETRLWVGRRFVETVNEVNRIIKEEAPDKLVFFWQHTNFLTLDGVPAGTPLSQHGLYPYYYADIIKPGYADGFMAYPNRPDIWENQYMRHVRKHGWLFFSQLSHPGMMRLQPWNDALEMVKSELPENLGYFFYCEGDTCSAAGEGPYLDPTVPDKPEWTVRFNPLHARLFTAQQGVGMDIIRDYFSLQIRMDVPLKGVKLGDAILVTALIHNPKDETYYLDPEEAVARDVEASIELPPGFIRGKGGAGPPPPSGKDCPGRIIPRGIQGRPMVDNLDR